MFAGAVPRKLTAHAPTFGQSWLLYFLLLAASALASDNNEMFQFRNFKRAAPHLCPDGWIASEWSPRCFRLFTQSKDFQHAEALCREHRSHLASFSSGDGAVEVDSLLPYLPLLSGATSAWIGARDTSDTNAFEFTDKSGVLALDSFTSPPITMNTELCVVLQTDPISISEYDCADEAFPLCSRPVEYPIARDTGQCPSRDWVQLPWEPDTCYWFNPVVRTVLEHEQMCTAEVSFMSPLTGYAQARSLLGQVTGLYQPGNVYLGGNDEADENEFTFLPPRVSAQVAKDLMQPSGQDPALNDHLAFVPSDTPSLEPFPIVNTLHKDKDLAPGICARGAHRPPGSGMPPAMYQGTLCPNGWAASPFSPSCFKRSDSPVSSGSIASACILGGTKGIPATPSSPQEADLLAGLCGFGSGGDFKSECYVGVLPTATNAGEALRWADDSDSNVLKQLLGRGAVPNASSVLTFLEGTVAGLPVLRTTTPSLNLHVICEVPQLCDTSLARQTSADWAVQVPVKAVLHMGTNQVNWPSPPPAVQLYGMPLTAIDDWDGDGRVDFLATFSHESAGMYGWNRETQSLYTIAYLENAPGGFPNFPDGADLTPIDRGMRSTALDAPSASDMRIVALGAAQTNTASTTAAGRVLELDFTSNDPTPSVLSNITHVGPTVTLLDNARFGTDVAVVGDLDNDGGNWAAVGAPGHTSTGALFLYALTFGGTIDTNQQQILTGSIGGTSLSSSGEFGRSVAPLGLLDDDLVPDIAVGALTANAPPSGVRPGGGVVYILFMQSSTVVRAVRVISRMNLPRAVRICDGSEEFGAALALAGDVTGDGIPDLLVGAPSTSTGEKGTVWVLHLTRDGAVADGAELGQHAHPELAEISGTNAFGAHLSVLGDIDGDGGLDIHVGAPFFPNPNDGATWIIRTSLPAHGHCPPSMLLLRHPPPACRPRPAKLPARVLANGSPPALTPPTSGSFGRALAIIGALDNSGNLTLAVGEPSNGAGEGKVVLITNPGAAGPTLSNIEWPAAPQPEGFRVGASVAAVGDVDGDGVPDIAVGAPEESVPPGGSHITGSIRVIALTPTGSVLRYLMHVTHQSPSSLVLEHGGKFGSSIAAVGDITQDGCPDLAVGARDEDKFGGSYAVGGVWILHAACGMDEVVDWQHLRPGDPAVRLAELAIPTLASTGFGASLAPLGDLDVDGVPDLVVGWPAHPDSSDNQNQGAIVIMFMRPDATVKVFKLLDPEVGTPFKVPPGALLFGYSLALVPGRHATDLPSLLVGAPLYDSGDVDTDAEGAVFLLALSREGSCTDARLLAGFQKPFSTLLFGVNGFPMGISVAVSAWSVAGERALSIAAQTGPGDGKVIFATSELGNGPPHCQQVNRGLGPAAPLPCVPGAPGWSSVPVETAGSVLAVTAATRITRSDLGISPTNPAFIGTAVTVLSAGASGKIRIAAGAPSDGFVGRVHIFDLDPEGGVVLPAVASIGPPISALQTGAFGTALASLGNWRQEGKVSLAIGAPQTDTPPTILSTGLVVIVHFNVSGTFETSWEIGPGTNGVAEALAENSLFGSAVASLGPLDAGDAYGDLAVSQLDTTAGVNDGRVWLLMLEPPSSVKRMVAIDSQTPGMPRISDNDKFGVSLATVGDLDGSGVPALAVGCEALSSDGLSLGAIVVLKLTRGGRLRSAVVLGGPRRGLEQRAEFGVLGVGLSAVGDVNDDGIPDLVAASPGASIDGVVSLRVLLLRSDGSSNHSVAIPVHSEPVTAAAGSALSVDRMGTSVAFLGEQHPGGGAAFLLGAPAGDGSIGQVVWVGTTLRVGASWNNAAACPNSWGLMATAGLSSEMKRLCPQLSSSPILVRGKFFASTHDSFRHLPFAALVEFGRTWSPVGDFDGDGLSEWRGAAQNFDTGSGRGGMVQTTLLPSGKLADVELVEGTGLHWGGARGSADDRLGSATVALGDWFLDGGMLLASGSSATVDGSTDAGAVYFQRLNEVGKLTDVWNMTLNHLPGQSPSAGDMFGFSLAALGDLNGDGHSELLVSASGAHEVFTVFLDVLGAVTGAVRIAQGVGGFNPSPPLPNPSDFGASMAGVGDLNADGVPDAIVGSQKYDPGAVLGRGEAWVLHLNAAGEAQEVVPLSGKHASISGQLASGVNFGSGAGLVRMPQAGTHGAIVAVACARCDEAVARRGLNTAFGILFLLTLSQPTATWAIDTVTTVTHTEPVVRTLPWKPSPEFGAHVSGAGDLAHDGRLTLVIAAPAFSNHEPKSGALYVLDTQFASPAAHSGATCPAALSILPNAGASLKLQRLCPNLLLEGQGNVEGVAMLKPGDAEWPPQPVEAGMRFGMSAAPLGDMDGDGTMEVAVGCLGCVSGEGYVFVYSVQQGGHFRLRSTLGDFKGGLPFGLTASAPALGSGVAGIGDLDGDGAPDLIIGHRGFTSGPNVGQLILCFLTPASTVSSHVKLDADHPLLTSFWGAGRGLGTGLALVGHGIPASEPVIAVHFSHMDPTQHAIALLQLKKRGGIEQARLITPGMPAFDAVNASTVADFGVGLGGAGDLGGPGNLAFFVGAPQSPAGPFTCGRAWLVAVARSDLSVQGAGDLAPHLDPLLAHMHDGADFGSSFATLGTTDITNNPLVAVGVVGMQSSSGVPPSPGGVLLLELNGAVQSVQVLTVRSISPSSTSTLGALAGTAGLGTALVALGQDGGQGRGTLLISAPEDSQTGPTAGSLAALRLPYTTSAHDTCPEPLASLGDAGSSKSLQSMCPHLPMRSSLFSRYTYFGNEAGAFPIRTLDANPLSIGSALQVVGDLDADGNSEWAIGVPNAQDWGPDSGEVFIMFMGPGGEPQRFRSLGSWLSQLVLPDETRFGSAIAPLGFVNDDNVADIAVSATGLEAIPLNARAGGFFVLFLDELGNVVGNSTVTDASPNMGGKLKANEFWGMSLCSLGDLNVDGVTDVMLGSIVAPFTDATFPGAVTVIHLDDAGLPAQPVQQMGMSGYDYDVPGVHDGAHFGISCAGIGDLNRDGIPDAAVGAWQEGQGLSAEAGAVFLLMLGSDGQLLTSSILNSATPGLVSLVGFAGGHFGHSLATLRGGDGSGDSVLLAVGQSGRSFSNRERAGTVLVLSLDRSGAVESATPVIEPEKWGSIFGELDAKGDFGSALAAGGDVDGDGFTDLLVGSRGVFDAGQGKGAFYLMHGTAQEVSAERLVPLQHRCPAHLALLPQPPLPCLPHVPIEYGQNASVQAGIPVATGLQAGWDVATLGDVDDDGVLDLAVGTRRKCISSGNCGSILIMSMQPGPSMGFISELKEGTLGLPPLTSGGSFGLSVTAVGDINSDGCPDFVAGMEDSMLLVWLRCPSGAIYDSDVWDSASHPALAPFHTPSNLFGVAIAASATSEPDTHLELLVGAQYADGVGGARVGSVYLLRLAMPGVLQSAIVFNDTIDELSFLAANAKFGIEVAVVGDIDNNGRADFAVTVGEYPDVTSVGSSTGAIVIMMMSPAATLSHARILSRRVSSAPGARLLGGVGLGHSLAPLGDLDADGVPDLLVVSVRSRRSHVAYLDSSGTAREVKELFGPGGQPIGLPASNIGRGSTLLGSLVPGEAPWLAMGAYTLDGAASAQGSVFFAQLPVGTSSRLRSQCPPTLRSTVNAPRPCRQFLSTSFRVLDGSAPDFVPGTLDVSFGHAAVSLSHNASSGLGLWAISEPGQGSGVVHLLQVSGTGAAASVLAHVQIAYGPGHPQWTVPSGAAFGRSLSTAVDWRGSGSVDLLVGMAGDGVATPGAVAFIPMYHAAMAPTAAPSLFWGDSPLWGSHSAASSAFGEAVSDTEQAAGGPGMSFLVGLPQHRTLTRNGEGAVCLGTLSFSFSLQSAECWDALNAFLKPALSPGSGFGSSIALLHGWGQLSGNMAIAVGAPGAITEERGLATGAVIIMAVNTLKTLVGVRVIDGQHPSLAGRISGITGRFGTSLARIPPDGAAIGSLLVGQPGAQASAGSPPGAVWSLSVSNFLHVTEAAVIDAVRGRGIDTGSASDTIGSSLGASVLPGGTLHVWTGLAFKRGMFVSVTALPLPSATPSASGTTSPTPTGSPTPSGSPSSSPSSSATASTSPTSTVTSTPTPTPSHSPSGTASATASPSSSGTGTPTASTTGTSTPAPTASSTGTPAPTPSVSPTPSATQTPLPRGLLVEGQTCDALWWSTCEQVPVAPSMSLLRPLPGVWCPGCASAVDMLNSSSAGDVVTPCPRYGSCEAGGQRGLQLRCAPGHSGPLCASCAAGFAPTAGSPCTACEACDANADSLRTLLLIGGLCTVLMVAALSLKAVSARGSMEQDLLVGAARILVGYVGMMGYVVVALQPFTEGGLSLTGRAVDVPAWHEACQRDLETHRAEVEPHVTRAMGNASALGEGIWFSDRPAYHGARESGSSDSFLTTVFQTGGAVTGALPISVFSSAACSLGHATIAQQFLATLVVSIVLFVLTLAMAVTVGTLTAAAQRLAQRSAAAPSTAPPSPRDKDTLPLVQSANPMLTRSPRSTPGQAKEVTASPAKGSKGKQKDEEGATPCAVVALWVACRTLWSLYLLLWGSAVGASLQLLSPAWSVRGGHYLPSTSLTVDPHASGLWGLALACLILHAAAFPIIVTLTLRLEAAHLLDKRHHASVTYAVMTGGYRLQLTPAQAGRAARTLAAGKAGASAEENHAATALAVSLSVRMSREMEQRCCGLARFVPSHAFALVRMVQNAVLLCALWLTTDFVTRVGVMVGALALVVLLTYSLQPYTLPELNNKDMQVTGTVMVHLILRAVWPAEPGVGIFLIILHACTVLVLAWAVLRGAFKTARTIGSAVRNTLAGLLPELRRSSEDAGAGGMPSVAEIGAALLSRMGVQACKRAQTAPTNTLSGAQRWASLVSTSVAKARRGASATDVVDAARRLAHGPERGIVQQCLNRCKGPSKSASPMPSVIVSSIQRLRTSASGGDTVSAGRSRSSLAVYNKRGSMAPGATGSEHAEALLRDESARGAAEDSAYVEDAFAPIRLRGASVGRLAGARSVPRGSLGVTSGDSSRLLRPAQERVLSSPNQVQSMRARAAHPSARSGSRSARRGRRARQGSIRGLGM